MKRSGSRPAFVLMAGLAFLGVCESVPAQMIGVEVTGALPGNRARHAAVLNNGQMYIIGGQQGKMQNFFRTVFRSTVDDNGVPGNWMLETPLPETRSQIDNATFVANNRLFVIGGYNGEGKTWLLTPISAPISPAGELGEWTASPSIPGEPRGGIGIVQSKAGVIAIGGLATAEKASSRPEVYISRFEANAGLGPWEEAYALPQPLGYAATAMGSDRVYVWGGLANSDSASATDKAFSAEVLPNGQIGVWREEATKISQPMFDNSAFAMGPYLFHVAPKYRSTGFSAEIFWTSTTTGSLGQFGRVGLATAPLEGMGIAKDPTRGMIFLTGGASGLPDDAGTAEIRKVKLRASGSGSNSTSMANRATTTNVQERNLAANGQGKDAVSAP